MKNNILFSEKQHFKQWWLMLIFLSIVVGLSLATYQQFIKNLPMLSIFIAWSIVLSVIALFYLMHLKTVVTEEAISIHFFPFLKKQITWNEIEKAYIREYNPLGEYGGWGIRFGLNKGMAYTIAGNLGLQLVLKKGDELLIGTQKEKELEVALRQLRKHSMLNY